MNNNLMMNDLEPPFGGFISPKINEQSIPNAIKELKQYFLNFSLSEKREIIKLLENKESFSNKENDITVYVSKDNGINTLKIEQYIPNDKSKVLLLLQNISDSIYNNIVYMIKMELLYYHYYVLINNQFISIKTEEDISNIDLPNKYEIKCIGEIQQGYQIMRGEMRIVPNTIKAIIKL